MIVCTGDLVTICPFYFRGKVREIRGKVREIKALPYGMISYLINDQWYSDPVFYQATGALPLETEGEHWKHLERSIACKLYPIVKAS